MLDALLAPEFCLFIFSGFQHLLCWVLSIARGISLYVREVNTGSGHGDGCIFIPLLKVSG